MLSVRQMVTDPKTFEGLLKKAVNLDNDFNLAVTLLPEFQRNGITLYNVTVLSLTIGDKTEKFHVIGNLLTNTSMIDGL